MKKHTQRLRSLDLDSDDHRHRYGKRQAGAAGVGPEQTRRALKTAYCPLAAVLALGSSLVNAQIPTCAAPGCNSVKSDNIFNTAVGTEALINLTGGGGGYGSNTALGYQALNQNMTGTANTASGVKALYSNTIGYQNTATGDGALLSNTTGYQNTASGAFSLNANTTGNYNTAIGQAALIFNTTGYENTASGAQALAFNSTGNDNTASGFLALYVNTSGNDNTASGFDALQMNTTGSNNTASGTGALRSNATASNNSAFGYRALTSNVTGTENLAAGADSLYSNTSGNYNSAYGVQALYFSTTASNNTASGYRALYRSTIGIDNTAAGFAALLNNTTGNGNTAVGYNALNMNTTGLDNIAIGNNAGYSVTDSNNIDIGNQGLMGDAATIRIGAIQSRTYVAGIYDNTSVSGLAVIVDSNGQLGTVSSSERFKTGIEPIGSNAAKLQQLRPVTFHYKADAQGTPQYGLIAEEVAKVYPELVVRNQNGRIDGVRYDELAPLLLNEVQRQSAEIRDLKKLVVQMQAGLRNLQAKDPPLAQR